VTRISMDWLAQAATATRSAYRRLAAYLSLGNLVSISWISIWLLLCVLIFQDLSRDLVTIEPLSTPKAFAEGGYTPEVASRRLHDALNQYADNAGTAMQNRDVQSREELPDFVLPKIDLSLSSVVASIRGVLRFGNGQRITGEFISRDKLLLRLRIDGHEVFSGSGDPNDPDELLARAAPAVIEKIRPYLVASTLFGSDPKRAVEKAEFLIDHLPPSDVNVQWSYMLKGFYLTTTKQLTEAEAVLRTAVKLNWSNPSAHAALGNALREQGRFEEAIAQYRRGIDIDPNFARAHFEFGVALAQQSRLDDAIAEYRRAIKIDPKYAEARAYLARVLFFTGQFDMALAENRTAVECAKTPGELAFARRGLADALSDVGDLDEAVVQYRLAIRNNPNDSRVHKNLGLTLAKQRKFDEAVGELQRALEIDPDFAEAKQGLDLVKQAALEAINRADPAKQ
jgi:tetratricopeptide (TPR) repeat protein